MRALLGRTHSLVLVVLSTGACSSLLDVDFAARPRDAAPDDAPPSDDAGTGEEDAMPEPRWCTKVWPAPSFCADFDGANVTEGWDQAAQFPYPGLQGGTSLTLDTSLYLGAGGASALVKAPALISANDTASAMMMFTLPLNPTHLEVIFDVYVTTERYEVDGNAIIATISWDSGGIALIRDGHGTRFGFIPHALTVPVVGRLQTGTWRNVDIEIWNAPTADDAGLAEAGADGWAELYVDSQPAGRVSLPAHVRKESAPRVLVGPILTGPSDPFQANIDNVVMYWR